MSASNSTVTIAGSTLTYPCRPGDTLLRAGLRAGIGMPYECNAGGCGSCKFELLSGEVIDVYPEATGIKQRDRDRGRRLACQTVPLGDCTIRTRADAACMPRHPPQRMPMRLESTRDITHDIREFTFRATSPARFLAGQYAMLQVAGTSAPRAYSMSNTANDGGAWRFMIRRTGTGIVSNILFALRLGTEVEIDGPYGLAYLREDSDRDIVCVAGGSGIAPMVAILDAAGALETFRARNAWLFYGGRGPGDVPALADLLGTHHLERRLEWHPVISVPALAEGTDWHGESGFVHELLPRKLPKALAEYEFYFAGPPPMIEATTRMLIGENKVPPSQLHFDRFF